MKKTFCDRCKKEVDGKDIQRYTVFDNNKAIDLCNQCYSSFYKWLHTFDEKNEEDIIKLDELN